eukprot:6234251-Alexandrium_andersonii.AAC.1
MAPVMASVGRRTQEGSEAPLWRGSGLFLGCLRHRLFARATTYPGLLQLIRLPRTVPTAWCGVMGTKSGVRRTLVCR